LEYTNGAPSWRLVLHRAVGGLRPRRRGQRQRGWSIGVPLIALAAGLLFTTTATTAGGTALRDDRRPQLAQLIVDKRDRLADREQRAAGLRAQVDQNTARLAEVDEPVKSARQRADGMRGSAGFTAVRGPGLTVVLNDSPRRVGDGGPNSPKNDDLVVHQGDVQAVVNALWAGGAEAMMLQDQRVVSTSAVRCVGNTVVLHGQVYGPPFVVTAIGDQDRMRTALDLEPGVELFQRYVERFGLGYAVTAQDEVRLPAYEGPLQLPSVVPLG
jgi:uncharacterized protein YlxW (UPF0749 family)